jgi:hypothetical protein
MLLIVGILLIIGLIAAVTKTKWFPYPSSWLKALGLTVPTWIGAVAAFNLLSWQFIFLYSHSRSREVQPSLAKSSVLGISLYLIYVGNAIHPGSC